MYNAVSARRIPALRKTVFAVHRPVFPRLKRNFAFLFAVRARRFMHLFKTFAVSTASEPFAMISHYFLLFMQMYLAPLQHPVGQASFSLRAFFAAFLPFFSSAQSPSDVFGTNTCLPFFLSRVNQTNAIHVRLQPYFLYY